ncbi:MAG: rhomboid family intramembrane serine protease [Cyclobacteriaceae bacterium]|nr:rhomboid family intramembrane serine protease [Cyclobacteriaceae bacterium]MCH8515655.1 rhomboid family intramembrane serine protease [Cyclobacteriaceae bacterium]
MFQQLTPVVKNLLIINVAVFALQAIVGLPLVQWLGLRYIFAESFQPYQLLTHMFVHASLGHLFGNMLGLFIFGPQLERTWGPKRFLIFYLACAFGASLLYTGVNAIEYESMRKDKVAYVNSPDPQLFDDIIIKHHRERYNRLYDFIDAYKENPDNEQLKRQSKQVVEDLYRAKINIPMVGASGAIFAILMAFAMLYPNVELFLLFLPVPIKAKYFVAIYGLYSLYAGIQAQEGDNVAHFAHLGGMVFAYFFVKYFQKQDFNRRQ